jgi:hypothetical protein
MLEQRWGVNFGIPKSFIFNYTFTLKRVSAAGREGGGKREGFGVFNQLKAKRKSGLNSERGIL